MKPKFYVEGRTPEGTTGPLCRSFSLEYALRRAQEYAGITRPGDIKVFRFVRLRYRGLTIWSKKNEVYS